MSPLLLLQIATFLVAAIGPFLAYRFARKLALAKERQAWLDALRDDVATLISQAEALRNLNLQLARTTEIGARQHLRERFDKMIADLQVTRFRIHLRLNTRTPSHVRLIEAVETFVQMEPEEGPPGVNRSRKREALVEATRAVLQEVWNTIERNSRRPRQSLPSRKAE